MKIRTFSNSFTFAYWINPAAIVAMLWCLIWMIWWGVYAHLGDSVVQPVRLPSPLVSSTPFQYHLVEQDITLDDYFDYIQAVAQQYDQERYYPVDEYLLVRSNPWLVDTLASTDYYVRKEKGEFVSNQRSLVVLHRGELLRIPDSAMVCGLLDEFGHTLLDLNISAYRLRIRVYDEVVYDIPVRVGRNERKYLAMAGAEVDLRTQPGAGKIIQINKDPDYINPSNNQPYYQTQRDDGRLTRLPRIPWLEPEINGQRLGQWIHPTTNIATLGKAYSNGCIGTSEADAWRLYYYAPLGTRINIRYELTEYDRCGSQILYEDVYGWQEPGA